MPFSFRLYYIKFKEVKILWGSEAGGLGGGIGYEGRGPDKPKIPKFYLQPFGTINQFL